MHDFSTAALVGVAMHRVGSKQNDEGLTLAKSLLPLDDDLRSALMAYFTQPFKLGEYFHLNTAGEPDAADVYACVGNIFDTPDALFEQSEALAQRLFEQSEHPKIKGGEFYVAHLSDCLINGETVDAVGLFKSENKDTFLQVGRELSLKNRLGINIHKLDKGCIIFNTEREKGFIVTAIDNAGRGADAQFWMDSFLQLQHRKDEFYNTQNAMALCHDFVQHELPNQFVISKADQAALLNKSVQFFKEKERFDMNEFADEVMESKEVIDSFNQYKNSYAEAHDLDIADRFDISDSAVKARARVLKSVIKLDKNFHIYVHGNRNLIEQGTDDSGRKFYKIYYTEET